MLFIFDYNNGYNIIQNTIEEIMKIVNKYLTNRTKLKSYLGYSPCFEEYSQKNDILFSWENESGGFGIGVHSDTDVIIKKLYQYIPYFIVPLSVIEDPTKKELINKIIKLEPNTILSIMYTYSLTNIPLLYKLLNINPHYLYQTFTLYLNKTIKKSKNIQNIKLDNIITDFIQTDEINHNPYKKLLMFYLGNKNIPPFMMDYTPILNIKCS